MNSFNFDDLKNSMKIKSFSMLALIFLMIISASCQFQNNDTTPKTYTCNYVDRALVIDGKLNDAQWENAEWSDNFVDIEGKKKPSPFLQTKVKMLWDLHYLYIAALLEEPDLWATLTNRDEIIYQDNDFEVFIDPDGDGRNYYEYEVNAFGTIMDLFLNKPYNLQGAADLSWNFKNIKSAVACQGTINEASDTDTSWTVELAIPWEAFTADKQMPPADGDRWRINFSRVEWDHVSQGNVYQNQTDPDGKPLPEHNWVWSPQGTINMHIPEKWGSVRFSGKDKFADAELPEFWIWINGGNGRKPGAWDRIFGRLKKAGITGLLVSGDSATLKKIIPVANSYQMQVHAWLWTMNNMEAKPEWLSVNRQGQSLSEQKAYVDYYKFMCPALPEVKEFIQNKIHSFESIPGIAGIHLDYIRYVDAILPEGLWEKNGLVQDHIMPEFDYGYHPYMRQLYEEKTGIDPFYLEDAENDTGWLNFRLEELNKTVIGVRDDAKNKGLTISAAVFPTPEMSRKMVRQDWDKWGLDCYFPMVYHNFYNEKISWIRAVVTEDKSQLPESAKLYCGLFLPALKNNNDLTKAISAAYSGGADGVAFFDLNALNDSLIFQIESFNQTRNLKPD